MMTSPLHDASTEHANTQLSLFFDKLVAKAAKDDKSVCGVASEISKTFFQQMQHDRILRKQAESDLMEAEEEMKQLRSQVVFLEQKLRRLETNSKNVKEVKTTFVSRRGGGNNQSAGTTKGKRNKMISDEDQDVDTEDEQNENASDQHQQGGDFAVADTPSSRLRKLASRKKALARKALPPWEQSSTREERARLFDGAVGWYEADAKRMKKRVEREGVQRQSVVVNPVIGSKLEAENFAFNKVRKSKDVEIMSTERMAIMKPVFEKIMDFYANE
ncbi:unnamed protein product [Amoebophrya sp. A120]|nr:unnamed protein product [Amoebophrya sp. A120]|eukprot:GSA120T00003795001.1